MVDQKATRSIEFLRVIVTYHIDIQLGRVYNSNGSEIGGRNPDDGRISCCISVKELHKSITVPRTHLVWWKATGKWPIQIIDHIDDIPYHDWFSNLQELTHRGNVIKGQQRASRVWLESEQGNSRPWLPRKV